MFYTLSDVGAYNKVRFQLIEVAESNHVFTICLNRPEKRNAFTPTMVRELAYALAYAEATPAIRCVVIKAIGPVFCAGMDLGVFENPETDQTNPTLPTPVSEPLLGEVFRHFSKPTIAQVQGPALAGGLMIVGGCLLVIAADTATFSLPEVKRGLYPFQVMASLLPIMPARKVLEMCVTARSYAATEALTMGLVTQVVSLSVLEATCLQLADSIAQNAPNAIRQGLLAFRKIAQLAQDEQHQFLKSELEALKLSSEATEGMAAFREKRPPNWP